MSQLYRCKAVDAAGKTRILERQASSEHGLSHELRKEGLSLVEVTPILEHGRKKLSVSQVLEFTQSLDVLFGQNLSLKDAIHVLATVNGNSALRILIHHLEEELGKGRSMSQALQKYQSSFPPIYLGLIRVGELTGTLKKVLPQLSKYLEDRKNLREKIMASLMYPVMVLAVLVIGMVLLTTLVLPAFLQVAQALQTPGTKAGNIGARLVGFQVVFSICVLSIPILAILLRAARKNRISRLAMDTFLLTNPIVSMLFSTIEMQNLCFALEALLEGGYTIDVALKECEQVTNNLALGQALEDVRAKTEKGSRLSTSFRETGILPQTFCSWVEIGEEAHDLKEVFKHLRDYYGHAFEKTTRTLMGLMEPGLIIMVGGVMLLVILQFIGPIFKLLGGAM